MTESVKEIKQPEKKNDDSWKDQVEKERVAQEQKEQSKPLSASVKEVGDNLKKQYSPATIKGLQPHQQAFILIYDPAERVAMFQHLQGIHGKSDIINILRDSLYKLEQSELLNAMLGLVAPQIAGAVAKAVIETQKMAR